MINTNKKMLLAAVGSSLLMVGSATAGSINSAITSVTAGGGGEFTINFNDSDQSLIIDSTGALKTSGKIEVGDMILGVINIDEVTGDFGTEVLGESTNPELTGFYALAVSGVTLGTPSAGFSTGSPDMINTVALTDSQVGVASAALGGAYATGFDPLAGFGSGGSAIVALFEDTADNFDGTLADFSDSVDGDFFQSYGGSDAFWDITAAFDASSYSFNNVIASDIAAASSAPTNETIASVDFGLDIVETGTSYLTTSLSNPGFDIVQGTGANVLKGGGGGPVNSDLSFAITATPSPTAALVGLAGFAFIGARRRRKVELQAE